MRLYILEHGSPTALPLLHRQTDRQTDRQTGRQAGRQTDRQTDRHTDRQTNTHTHTHTHATLPTSTKRNLQPWIGRRRCGSLEDRCAELLGLWQPQMLMLHHAALGLGRVLLHSSLIHMFDVWPKPARSLQVYLQPNLAELPLATARR